MACLECRRRSALVAALTPAISRLSLHRESLLSVLALPNAQLLHAAKVKDRREFLRGLQLPLPSTRVPTALCRHDPDYPETLAQLDCAPAVLYATCTTDRLREQLSKPTIAIVGSRTPTDYAQQIAAELARDLAAVGATVISGMNRGLEGTVHESALQAGGRTIAVMPYGPELAYPRANSRLHQSVLARGAAVSELPPGFCLRQRCTLIAHQRIIAALARLIVVVETGEQCGGLFTAQIGSELGAEVAVVPGRVTAPGGQWVLGLLRDGAHPVARAEDVLNAIHGHDVCGLAA